MFVWNISFFNQTSLLFFLNNCWQYQCLAYSWPEAVQWVENVTHSKLHFSKCAAAVTSKLKLIWFSCVTGKWREEVSVSYLLTWEALRWNVREGSALFIWQGTLSAGTLEDTWLHNELMGRCSPEMYACTKWFWQNSLTQEILWLTLWCSILP